MPRRNGTGPEGRGPLTGRGLGPCGGGSARRAGRRVPRRVRSQRISEDDEKEILEQRLEDLEAEEEGIKQRLEDLE